MVVNGHQSASTADLSDNDKTTPQSQPFVWPGRPEVDRLQEHPHGRGCRMAEFGTEWHRLGGGAGWHRMAQAGRGGSQRLAERDGWERRLGEAAGRGRHVIAYAKLLTAGPTEMGGLTSPAPGSRRISTAPREMIGAPTRRCQLASCVAAGMSQLLQPNSGLQQSKANAPVVEFNKMPQQFSGCPINATKFRLGTGHQKYHTPLRLLHQARWRCAQARWRCAQARWGCVHRRDGEARWRCAQARWRCAQARCG